MAEKWPYLLGVTGGIGSGKSAACRILEKFGARIFHADDVSKDILRTDLDVRSAVITLFGPESYSEDGKPDFAHIAGGAFVSRNQLDMLNHLLHPRVFDRLEEAVRTAANDGVRIMVMEAALIFQTGEEARLDSVWVVNAPEDLRIERVMQRDGMSAEEVKNRMRFQMDPQEMIARADKVIPNKGTPEELESRLRVLWEKLENSRK